MWQGTLRRADFFGQYGKVLKVVINRNMAYSISATPTMAAYVTYAKADEANACVRGVGEPPTCLKIGCHVC